MRPTPSPHGPALRARLADLALAALALAALGGAAGCMQLEGFRKPLEIPPDYILNRQFEAAEELFAAGEHSDAAELYQQLGERYLPHRHSLASRVRLAEIDLARGDLERAERRARAVVEEGPDFDVPDHLAVAGAHKVLGTLLYDRGHWHEARGHFEAYIADVPGSPEAGGLLLRIGQIHERRDQMLLALRAYDRGLDWATDPEEIGEMKASIRAIVEHKTTARQLNEISLLYAGRYAAHLADLRRAELEGAGGDTGTATARLRGLIEQGDPAMAIEAERVLRGLRGSGEADPTTVAAILPLSGKYARFGQLALEGLMASAGVFEGAFGAENGLRWIVRDTEGDPVRAASLVRVLADVHKVVAIVGPMASEVAEAAAVAANDVGVPLITLARRSDLEGLGEFVYRSSLTDTDLARGLARVAVFEEEIERFAVLYPGDAYGEGIRDRFALAVEARGGQIVAAEPYDPDAADFGEPIGRLMHAAPEAVRREGDELVLGFDALFVPGQARTLSLLVPQLAYYDVVTPQLLGTNAMNSRSFVEEAGDFAQGAIFVDGFLPSSSDARTRAFVDRFFLDLGREPGLVEALAFEVGELLEGHLLSGAVESRIDLLRQMLRTETTPGVVGLLGFDATGEAVRDLKILTVAGPEIVELRWPPEPNDEAGLGIGAAAPAPLTSISLDP